MEFADKVAVVTGGANGIGRGIARALAREGAHVVVADVDCDAAEALAQELRGTGVRALALRTDVRERASVEELARAAVRELGAVDLVFANAGVYLGGELRDTTEDDWRWILSVNLTGVFHTGQVFAALLREQKRGGHIVNTGSIASFLVRARGMAYGVSKFGVAAYTEALRADLAPHGIGVSLLCPGPIATTLPTSDRLRPASHSVGGRSDALGEMIRDGMPPDEVGPIVLDGVRANAPYIFTHDFSEPIRQHFEAVLQGFEALRQRDRQRTESSGTITA